MCRKIKAMRNRGAASQGWSDSAGGGKALHSSSKTHRISTKVPTGYYGLTFWRISVINRCVANRRDR